MYKLTADDIGIPAPLIPLDRCKQICAGNSLDEEDQSLSAQMSAVAHTALVSVMPGAAYCAGSVSGCAKLFPDIVRQLQKRPIGQSGPSVTEWLMILSAAATELFGAPIFDTFKEF